MIHIATWGKDHWSAFAYAETLAVDHEGIIIPEVSKMRTNHKTHPFLGGLIDGGKYPTKLRNGNILRGHDDWDCLDDAVKNGLLMDIGSSTNKAYKLTKRGRKVANLLREHKSKGRKLEDFSEYFDIP
jgi:hypothetical protein